MSNFGKDRRSQDLSEEKDQLLEDIKQYTDFDFTEDRSPQPNNGSSGTGSGTGYRALDAKTIGLVLVAVYRNISWQATIRNTLHFLKPSFLQGPEARAKIRPAKLHPTSYLDGMRGTAAFSVFIFHLLYSPYMTERGWGANNKHYDFWRLPIIRLPYQGSIGVAIFFVISGYALSYRPIKLVRSGKMLDGYQSLTSTLLRRWARLFLPTAASTFMILLLLRVGAYESLRRDLKDKVYWRNFVESHPARAGKFTKQLWHWIQQQWLICDVTWKGAGGLYYDGHLWTIPTEFRNSLFLFLTILGTSRLQAKFRIALVVFIIIHCWSFARWDFCLFLSGMLLAEWDHIRGAHVASALPTKEASTTPKRSTKKLAFWIALNIFTLFLMSTPDTDCGNTPGYRTLCGVIPKWWGQRGARALRWWQSIAAVLWVLSVGHLPFWQRYYESGVVQYLGKISYALYLVHGMVLKAVALPLELWLWKNVTGIEGTNRFVGWFMGACVSVPLCVWWADVFWRMIDIPAVSFGKWAEGKVLKRD